MLSKINCPENKQHYATKLKEEIYTFPYLNYEKKRVTKYIYSVTQSYGNSFWGDFVSDSFNNSPFNILDKIYTKTNLFGLLLWGFKVFRVIEENAYLKK